MFTGCTLDVEQGFQPQNVANLLWAFARLGQPPPPHYWTPPPELLDRAAEVVCQRLGQFNEQG
jgi:hypothetical protein